MGACGQRHPDHPDVVCQLGVPHPAHTGRHLELSPGSKWVRPNYIDWPNEDYKPPAPGPGAHKRQLKELASQVPPENRLARGDDPGAAHEAIRTYSRTRYKTRLGKVANFFLNHLGEWHDAVRFVDEEVGGFAGTRRVRELREEYGWDIEIRKHPDPAKPNTHQYRLNRMPEIID
jgi:hypothetical protein